MIPVDLHKIFLGLLAGFSERTPYPLGKAKRWGCGQKSLPGLLPLGSWERFPFEGLG